MEELKVNNLKINNSSENKEAEMIVKNIDDKGVHEKLENYVKEGYYSPLWNENIIEIGNGESITVGTLIKKYTRLNDELWRSNQYMEDLELSIIDYLVIEENMEEVNNESYYKREENEESPTPTCDFLPEEVLRKVKFPDGMQFYKINVEKFYIFKNPEENYDHIDAIFEIGKDEYVTVSSLINKYIRYQNIFLGYKKYINQLLNDLRRFGNDSICNSATLDRYAEIEEGKFITIASLREKFIKMRYETLIKENCLLEMGDDLKAYDPNYDASEYRKFIKCKDINCYCKNSLVFRILNNVLDDDYPYDHRKIYNKNFIDKIRTKGIRNRNDSDSTYSIYDKFFSYIEIEKERITGNIVNLDEIVEIRPGRFITVASLISKYLFLLDKLWLNYLIYEKIISDMINIESEKRASSHITESSKSQTPSEN